MKSRILGMVLVAQTTLMIGLLVGYKLGDSNGRKGHGGIKAANQDEVISQKRRLVAEKQGQWEKGNFLAIAEPLFPAKAIEAIDNKLNSFDLSTVQKTELRALVKSFFETYATHSYEGYLAFKTQNRPFVYSSGESVAKLTSFYKGKGAVFSSNPEEIAMKLWDLKCRPDGKSPTKLTKVDLGSYDIVIGKTNTTHSGIAKVALRKLNNMIARPVALVECVNSPQEVIRKEKDLMYAIVGVVCMVDSAGGPTPIFVSFYWSDHEQKWFPWEITYDTSSKFRAFF